VRFAFAVASHLDPEILIVDEVLAVGDAPLFYYYASRGKIGYIDDTMAVYRIRSGGVWSSTPVIEILLNSLSTRLLIRNKQKIFFSTDFHKGTLELILRIAKQYRKENDRLHFRKFVTKSIPYFFFADNEQRKVIVSHIKRIILSSLSYNKSKTW